MEKPESVAEDKTDRKEQLQELLKATVEQLSPETKKPEVQAKDDAKKSVKEVVGEKAEAKPKKTSVKSKLREGKEKAAKTPTKKMKEKEAQACV